MKHCCRGVFVCLTQQTHLHPYCSQEDREDTPVSVLRDSSGIVVSKVLNGLWLTWHDEVLAFSTWSAAAG